MASDRLVEYAIWILQSGKFCSHTTGVSDRMLYFDSASGQRHWEFGMGVRVSVILPTFNRSQALRVAALSVLNQSFKDLELIIVDDGSIEDIGAVVDSIDDPRIVLIKRQRNGGPGAARNTGLAAAEGEYIAFQDSDDIWLPDKLKNQLDLFSGLPPEVEVLTAGRILYGRDDWDRRGSGRTCYIPSAKTPLKPHEDQIAHLLRENRLSPQTTLFKRHCYPGDAWFDVCAKGSEDWEFAIRLAKKTKIYEYVGPVVFGYVSDDSVSINPRKKCLGLLRILKANRDLLLRYQKQHGLLLYDLSRNLHKLGKARFCRDFLILAVVKNPTILWYLAVVFVKNCLKLFPSIAVFGC